MPAMRHHLLFYENSATLIDRVADFAREGLAADEIVVIVATADHAAALEAHLAATGCDPAMARATGTLRVADAAQTLARFCTKGAIDIERFDCVIGEVVRDAVDTGKPVRIFGEMVAVLWEAGHTATAVHLEQLWDALIAHEPFELLCAYPSDVLVFAEDHAAVNHVCELHAEVVLGDKTAHATRLQVYPATLAAVRAARHFVDTCVAEGATRLGRQDALLIASELSANAVCHARTSFVLALSWHDDVLRIGVRDAYHGRPKVRPPDDHSGSGRGMAMIDTISARWGVEPHGRGKTVWAELPL